MAPKSKRYKANLRCLAMGREVLRLQKLGLASPAKVKKITTRQYGHQRHKNTNQNEETEPSSSQLELIDLDYCTGEVKIEPDQESSTETDGNHVNVKEEPQDLFYNEASDDDGDDSVKFPSFNVLFAAENQRAENTVKVAKPLSPLVGGTGNEQVAKRRKLNSPFPCILCFKNTPYDLSWLDNCTDKDFMAIFILKKMLQVPSEHLQEYLKQLKEPKRMLHVCTQCKPVVIEAFGVQQEINILERKLRAYQESMGDKIKTTISRKLTKAKTPDCNNDTLAIKGDHHIRLQLTHNTRRFVTTGIWPSSLVKLLKSDNKVVASSTQQPSRPQQKRGKTTAKTVKIKESVGAVSDSCCAEDEFLDNQSYDDDDDGHRQSCASPVPQHNHVSVITQEEDPSSAPADTPEQKMIQLRALMKKRKCPSNRNKEYMCKLCPNLEMRGAQSFVEHVLYHYERPYQCSECDTFWTGSQLELENYPQGIKHKKRGLDENHRCSMANLVKVKYRTGKIWKCADCWESFRLETERDAHEKQVHSDKPAITLPFSCGGCSKMLRNINEFQVHRVLEHEQLAKFWCFYCNEIFKFETKEGIDILDEKALRDHIVKVHNRPGNVALRSSKFCECELCGANYENRNQLADHFTKCHGVDKNAALFSCRVCYARFRKKTLLPLHFKMKHCQNRPEYICEVCAYKTQCERGLLEHKLRMHDIEPEAERKIYNCTKEDCSYRCVTRRLLQQHMIKEHGLERRFKCKFCGKGFLSSSHLCTHERIHLNANTKPYQCEICGNSFAVRNYLYIHMRLSHQNRPFASTNKKRPYKDKKKAVISEASTERPPSLLPPLEFPVSVPQSGNLETGEEPLAQDQLYTSYLSLN